MRTASLASLFVTLALLCGCALLPEWRVFQKKVDAKLAEKPAEQVEAERRAAKFIEQRSAPAVATVLEAQTVLGDIRIVATNLSRSLGEPKESVTAADKDRIISELRQGLLAEQEKAEQWRAFAKKYAGRELEGTGIDLAGPTGLLVFAGIIVACIACPTFGYVLLRLVPVLWAGLKRAAGAVEALAKEAPAAVARVKATLPQKEDAARKAVRLAKCRAVASHPLAA